MNPQSLVCQLLMPSILSVFSTVNVNSVDLVVFHVFRIADTLRGLFSLFASHIIKNAAHALDACNSGKAGT